jgi:hypothetical protein
MTFNIKPQDKRPLEKIEFELHPDLIQQLKNLAQSLNDSDLNYVLTQILEQAFRAEKSAKKDRSGRASKSAKEGPRRAA